MQKCLQCHSTMKSDEQVCWACDAAVPPREKKTELRDRFKVVVNILFIVFAVLTVASLFTDYVPSFWKCFGGTLILYFVKNSVDQMVAAKKE
jgi:hypothetical protein